MTALIQVIAGPTASGKSALAIETASTCNGVVINADALQVYGALPLLTAQPSVQDCAAVPHKLYGVLSPSDICSVTRWVDMAVETIRQTLVNGQTPIIVGGTGFYLKGLMEGLSPIPDIAPAIREKMIARQQELGNPGFHTAFAQADPVMAARLHPNDTQRLIRAWEVLEGTGESLSVWQSRPPQPPVPEWRFDVLILDPDRETLYDRCNKRFGTMMDQGALDEVRAFDRQIEQGLAPAQGGVTQALGFDPLRNYLHGHVTLNEAIERAQADTRQYAKRQVTWLRHQIKEGGLVRSLRRY